MISREKARALRALIEKATISLSDDDAINGVELYPVYNIGTAYSAGDRFRYGDKLYKVVQAHTSQSDWRPDELPALYTEVAPEGTILPWHQPTGAHDTYQVGDKVTYEGWIWENDEPNNSFPPDVWGWHKVKEIA